MEIMKTIYKHARKPEGWLGKLTLTRMNLRHRALADWGLAHLKLFAPLAIAELGCGGGRVTAELLRMFPHATVTALDHSQVSVEKTRKRNHGEVVCGRCQVVQGDLTALPFKDDCLDLATAFETVYYWPGPVESFREVWRTLRPGGIFMIVNEADGEHADDEKYAALIENMRIYDKMALIRALKEAGFGEFSVDHEPARHWLCVMARK